MKFSFGIITNGKNDNLIRKTINSIRQQNIPGYEIIIVGNSSLQAEDVLIIRFDENSKKNWITKKKNLITKAAAFENVVYMHDYICPGPDWYNGFVRFGNNFDVCMTKIKNLNGERYRDWSIDVMASIAHIVGDQKYSRLLPYKDLGLSKIMYISGAYWVAKKDIMMAFPLKEELSWGEAEDIEWSHRIRRHINFSINPHSTVHLLKHKKSAYTRMSNELVNKFMNISDKDLKIITDHAEKYYKKTHGEL
jgi:hypothetical protein